MVPFEKAMLSPAECFAQPADVLRESWTREQKYQVLRQWKYDIGQLHVATEENMQPDRPRSDPVSVGQVHDAMEALGYAPDTDPVPSKGA
jgi:hypothetical protein